MARGRRRRVPSLSPESQARRTPPHSSAPSGLQLFAPLGRGTLSPGAPRPATPRAHRTPPASPPRLPGTASARPRRSEDAPGEKAALRPGLPSKEAVRDELGSPQAAMPGCPKSGCQVMPDSRSWRGSLGTVTSLRRICPLHHARPVSSSSSPLLCWAPQDPACSFPTQGVLGFAVSPQSGGGPRLAISCRDGVGSLRQEPQKLELFLRGHRRAANSSPRPSPGAQRGR